MAVLLSEAPPYRSWTREEIYLAQSAGLFDSTHFELIEGELINKLGKKRPHVNCNRNSMLTLERVFGFFNVEKGSSIDVAPEDNPHNEAVPDVVVMNRSGQVIDTNPQPSDVALVVEVADSSLRHDLTVKARLYARAGIPEYWVLDVNNRCLHVLRAPHDGTYQEQFQLAESESVSPLARTDARIPVTDLLG